MTRTHQVAAIPIRRSASGATEVLLVTSRGSQRWVVPKGWPWAGRPDHEAAAGEAWEEAGVRGDTTPNSIGSYTYRKNTGVNELVVHVYVMDVTEVLPVWPERTQRRRKWLSLTDAAACVAEPELAALLLTLGDV